MDSTEGTHGRERKSQMTVSAKREHGGTVVPFSVTGGAWEKPVHVWHIEEETSFLGILSVRCLLQIYPAPPRRLGPGSASTHMAVPSPAPGTQQSP